MDLGVRRNDGFAMLDDVEFPGPRRAKAGASDIFAAMAKQSLPETQCNWSVQQEARRH